MSAEPIDGPATHAVDAITHASPSQVRAGLTPESAGEFDRQWRAAMLRATESLDLTEVFDVLTGWRHVAALTTRLGDQGYRDFLATAQRRLAGDPSDAGVDTVGAGVQEVDALIRTRLAQGR